jgi:hypothetical protein
MVSHGHDNNKNIVIEASAGIAYVAHSTHAAAGKEG